MNNTEEQVSKLEDKLTNNEKEESIINIDFQTVVEPAKQPLNSGNITDQYANENDKNSLNEVILVIENEKQDNVDQQKSTVELVDKQRKAPDVWVQYLREVKGNNSPAKQIEVGSRRGSGGRNYQHQGGSGGGFHYDPSRNSFLLLVFTILLVMLALTFLYNVVVLTSPSMSDFYRTNRRALLFLSVGVLIVMSYVMICCLPCVRITPCNYISLLIVLVATSNLTAVLTALVRTHIILFALIGTSVTVAICLLLALSKFDFTAWYLYIMVIGIVIAVLSLALGLAHVCFDIYFKPLHMALLYVATIFQVILLVMELQMVIGGRSIEINEEDYVLAAYLLYTSIVNLFLQILQIIADFSD